MLKVKEFISKIQRVETTFALYCMVTIDDKEREISALVTEDGYYTNFDWSYGIEGISDEDLNLIEIEMLHNLENN
tara:strand:+ start:1593 stop:1817 length:225 start_codon:yes stop_codon:yes gene_type:complete